MAHPHRDADAARMHARRLPAAGKLTRVGRRERSLPARMGSRYSARLLMLEPQASVSIADRASLRSRQRAPAIGEIATTISRAGAGVVGASAILRARTL